MVYDRSLLIDQFNKQIKATTRKKHQDQYFLCAELATLAEDFFADEFMNRLKSLLMGNFAEKDHYHYEYADEYHSHDTYSCCGETY